MNADLVHGGVFTVMVVRVGDPSDPEFESRLAEQVARSPAFFANAPVVLDLEGVTGCATADAFHLLKRLFKRQHLIAVGITNANGTQIRAAMNADLAAFPPSTPRKAGSDGSRAAPSAVPSPEASGNGQQATIDSIAKAVTGAAGGASKTRIVTQPVRSGTQIYARGGDLVVLSQVSPGAEVIADGNVHIYGALRGRAIAGASGDAEARIFTERLEAELLCVAGHYLVSEAIAKAYLGQAVQVMLVGEELAIARRPTP